MSFWTFLLFEVVFLIFWTFVWLSSDLVYRIQLMLVFDCLMLTNGIQHLMWAFIQKKYVPGLATAPFFIIIFVWIYFS